MVCGQSQDVQLAGFNAGEIIHKNVKCSAPITDIGGRKWQIKDIICIYNFVESLQCELQCYVFGKGQVFVIEYQTISFY